MKNLKELNKMLKRNQDALGGFSINEALEQFENRKSYLDKFLKSFGEHPLMKSIKNEKRTRLFHIELREYYNVMNPSESINIKYEFSNGYNASVIYGMYSMNRWEVMITKNNKFVGEPKRCKDFERVEEILLDTMFK